MEKTVILVLLCTAATGQIRQHVFIPTPKTWPDAQAHCRQHYSDLSFVVSQSDQDQLLEAAGDNCPQGWIGLQRRPDNNTAWMWSGGAEVTYQNWAYGQPERFLNGKNVGFVKNNGKWIDGHEDTLMSFYCISVTTLEERKSWDDARAYCVDQRRDLPGLLTRFDRYKLLLVLYFNNIRESVWLGLYCWNNDWTWVNGSPLVSHRWLPEDANKLCPTSRRCAAFTSDDGWRNWDCNDSLKVICS